MNEIKLAYYSVANQYKNIRQSREYAGIALRSLIFKLQGGADGAVVLPGGTLPRLRGNGCADGCVPVRALRVRDDRLEVIASEEAIPAGADLRGSDLWFSPTDVTIGFEDEIISALDPIMDTLED